MAGCAYCGRDLSYSARTCPDCGHVVSDSDYRTYEDDGPPQWWTALAFVVATGACLGVIGERDASNNWSGGEWIGFLALWVVGIIVCIKIGSFLDRLRQGS